MTSQDHNEIAAPGGKIGGRVGKLVADASVYSRQRMATHQNQVAQKILADFTNHISDELRGVVGNLFKDVAQRQDTPKELKGLFRALGEDRGQAWALVAGTATGAAMGGGLMNMLSNALNPIVLPIIAGDPNGILSPTDAAAATLRGILNPSAGAREAAMSGIDSSRFNALTRLMATIPGTIEIVELRRRNLIDDVRAHGMLRAAGVRRDDAELLLRLEQLLLTPEQLAAMVNRDIVSPEAGAKLAALSGTDSADFQRLTLLGGDPLPPQDLGTAFRRGFIDRARFNRGIVQGPLRKEWFDVLEKLQFSRMSTVDAADAVNQGHMSASEGKRIAHENGLDPDDFGILLETAGQPPGIEFAQEAWNRGFIGESEFGKMFLESRIKNRYLPLLKRMRTRLIPQETARLLYRQGVYTEAQALSTLLAHGFSRDDASALLALERTRGDDTTRELTRSQIVDLYEERMINLSETLELLLGMGYSENDARAMIELADLQRLRRFVTSALTRIKGAYINGRIDEIDATTQMDRLRIPVEQRDDVLALWDIERTTVSKTLTASQVRQAYRKDLITLDDAMQRLTSQGYDAVDADLYLQLTA